MRILAAIALAGALTAGDVIELELAQWRHQPDQLADLLEARNMLREQAAKPAFDLLMIRRDWADQAPGLRHNPVAERMAPMGRRSSQ